jgi:error-prone DNA polymerase
MSLGEHVIADYRTTGLSLKAHPCTLLREKFQSARILPCVETTTRPDGARLRIGGIVTVRQRPGTARGTVFITLEDETGIANIIVWPALVETFRNQILSATLLIVEGRLQRSPEGVTHIVAERMADRSSWLAGLDTPLTPADAPPHKHPPGHPPRHPRQERILRKSRDFH